MDKKKYSLITPIKIQELCSFRIFRSLLEVIPGTCRIRCQYKLSVLAMGCLTHPPSGSLLGIELNNFQRTEVTFNVTIVLFMLETNPRNSRYQHTWRFFFGIFTANNLQKFQYLVPGQAEGAVSVFERFKESAKDHNR